MEDSILDLEKLRSKAASLLKIIIVISFAVIILSFFIFISNGVIQIGVFFSIPMGLGIGYLLGKITGYFKISGEFKNRFKATFVETPFREAFSPIVYQGEKGIEQEVIKETGIMCLGNLYTSNDYIQGYYKDVKFERADIKIQQHVSTGKTSYTVTYLHGRWLIFEFNKEFHFDLQIVGNKFPNAHKKSSFFTESEERRYRIKLEDMDFNDMFDVFCQDDHEAYYILTPHFMSMLKDLQKNMDGSIMFGFVENKLHVAIHNNKDAMEPKIFDEIDFGAVKEEAQKEIKIIMNIIDGLGLDRDIYE